MIKWKRHDGQIWTFDDWEQLFYSIKSGDVPEIWDDSEDD